MISPNIGPLISPLRPQRRVRGVLVPLTLTNAAGANRKIPSCGVSPHSARRACRVCSSGEHGRGAKWEQTYALNGPERTSTALNEPAPTCGSPISAGQRDMPNIVHTEEVAGSIPASPTPYVSPLTSTDRGLTCATRQRRPRQHWGCLTNCLTTEPGTADRSCQRRPEPPDGSDAGRSPP
jgi:hypothetical protein